MKVFMLCKNSDLTKLTGLSYDKIITGFYATKESTSNLPFEILIIDYLESLGSFNPISDEQWNEIHKAHDRYKVKFK
jgi:nicotinamide riboside kinase